MIKKKYQNSGRADSMSRPIGCNGQRGADMRWSMSVWQPRLCRPLVFILKSLGAPYLRKLVKQLL